MNFARDPDIEGPLLGYRLMLGFKLWLGVSARILPAVVGGEDCGDLGVAAELLRYEADGCGCLAQGEQGFALAVGGVEVVRVVVPAQGQVEVGLR